MISDVEARIEDYINAIMLLSRTAVSQIFSVRMSTLMRIAHYLALSNDESASIRSILSTRYQPRISRRERVKLEKALEIVKRNYAMEIEMERTSRGTRLRFMPRRVQLVNE